MRRHVFQRVLLEHLDNLFRVNGQVGHGIDVDNGRTGVGVDKVVAIALPQNIQYRRLVKVPIQKCDKKLVKSSIEVSIKKEFDCSG